VKTDRFDLERARRDPRAVFVTPERLVESPDLTREQKIELLRRWEYDEREISVAEEEGMRDGEPMLLARIVSALEELTGGLDLEHTPPTKQGGV